MPQPIFWPVIVDREANVILPHELLDSWQSFQCGVARDNDGNTRSLAVFELSANVGIFVFREIDRPGSMKLNASRGIVRERSRFLLQIRREMIFDILCIQLKHIELFHETDHLRTTEVAERVAGETQSNRRSFVN